MVMELAGDESYWIAWGLRSSEMRYFIIVLGAKPVCLDASRMTVVEMPAVFEPVISA